MKDEDLGPIDMITCRECQHLRGGNCWGFTPKRTPIPALLRRCEKFFPISSLEDRRIGVERWPDLVKKEEEENAYRDKD